MNYRKGIETPYRQWPALAADSKQLHESVALTRYYGRKAGLDGCNEWEDLQIDTAVDIVTDLRLEITRAYEDNQNFLGPNYTCKAILNSTIFRYIRRIDKLILDNGGYLANGKLSWGDIYFIAILDYLNGMARMRLQDMCPRIKYLRNKVINLPKFKKYILAREPGERYLISSL